MDSEFLIVGLGNPGANYADTRHNMGFLVADALASRLNLSFSKGKYNCEQARANGSPKLTVVKPLSYMNKSGIPVQNVSRFYDIAPNRLVVIHDDLDLPWGTLRLKQGGGHGGHNGLRSIIQMLGTNEFMRLRMGIGRPAHGDPADYVLGRFSAIEKAEMDDYLQKGADALEYLFKYGIAKAMTAFNQAPKPPDA